MTQVISLVTPSQAMTPTHSPTEVDDYERPRAFRAVSDTPDSPSPRTAGLARKRAASINTADASYARLEKLNNPKTPTSMTSEGSRDLICLCTPAPKIPRPRNAFILYRQHHQAEVVAHNPNLSNPEISKIIGEQWKEESEEVKSNWKALADKEKQNHQRLYPDYRYQPRRGTKTPGNRPGSSPADDSGRCPKCHGRSIATPRTPSTPFAAPVAAKPVVSSYTSTLRGDEVEMARRGSYGSLPSAARLRYPPPRPGYQDVDDYDPEAPEIKRRRFNTSGGYHNVSPPGQGARTLSIGAPPVALRPYPATPFPEPGASRSKSGPMPPPPRPAMAGPWLEQSQQPSRHRSYDESLTLPPLQTSVPMSPSTATEVDIRQLTTPVTGLGISSSRDPQARSVEAMVMSIPFTKKLSVLARINQPIAASRHDSPGPEKRGAVIAIEGPKPGMLQQVARVVENALLASNEVALKMWGNGLNKEQDGASDRRGSLSERSPTEAHDSFTTCFETVIRWHQNSRDIAKHIISRDDPDKNDDTRPPTSSRRGSAQEFTYTEPREKGLAPKVPVALLREGFSLTLSDAFACTIPIADSYAPVDHWQWMATLWRGVIGPDLVVYVKPSIEEEVAKLGTVEFQKRPALMVVRIVVGKDLDDATERRVAFEVIEWVRGASFREEHGKM
ncbi:hypothetical protein ACJ41O_004656 [Fusarium nematophilum]